MKKFRDLTPEQYRCALTASCPAVLKTEDDEYYIIGTTLNATEVGLSEKVAPHETAIKIPAALLEAVIAKVLEDPQSTQVR